MVLAAEPLSMPPLQRYFEGGGVEKVVVCLSLEADSVNYLALCGTRLVFQEKVAFESGKMRQNHVIDFTKMDENDNL
jgi:hypothetical protein